MNKVLTRLVLISFALLATACGGTKPSESSEPSESSDPVISSSSEDSSSSTSSSSAPAYVDNQLSTPLGFKVYFKEEGAKIDKIEYNGKKIAEDGFNVGRCANRIAAGKCTLNGQQLQLTKNNNGNHLHGGNGSGMNSWRGPFATSNWTKVSQDASSIKYSFHSPDGNNGYPGNMDMTVTYTLSPEGKLDIEYSATTDKDTLCNPTNHLFMTLNGNTSYDNIKLWIDADNYTPLTNQLPTGEIAPVAGTQFDYSVEKAFDKSKSYDDNYVLKGTKGSYRKVASMTGTTLGISVDVYTDRAGLQLYKENNGRICLEAQQFPDAINHENFLEYGTTILRANETFSSKTTYHFQIEEK